MKNILIAMCCAFSFMLNAQQPLNGPSSQSFNYNSIVNSAYNPSNGTANITIPIANIGEGSIGHSIALVSNTDAPKAHESASTVGLGWSLMGGGMISRSIRSLPDDEENGYYIEGGYGIDVEEVLAGNADSEPDMYFFNAGSLSGSFTIDEDGDFHTIPKSRIKIEVELDGIENFTNFIITDDLGVKYHFGRTDENYPYPGLELNLVTESVSGWMLNKIESLDGELHFEYEAAASRTHHLSEQLIHTYVDIDNNDEIINSELINTGNLDNTDDVFQMVNSLTYVPTKIISSTRTIEFNYSDDREDNEEIWDITSEGIVIYYPKRLTEIKIVEGDITDCTKYTLTQSYFIDNSTPISSWNYPTRVSKRLKFDNIIQKSCSGQELPPTTIEYYGGSFFPNQFHTSIDDWGYYNAAGNGPNLIKAGFDVEVNNIQGFFPLNFNLSSPGQANRNPNLEATKNGAIKKINYPTGGSISYDYGLNTESTILTDLELFNLSASTPCDENLPACCDWIYSEYTASIFFSSDIIETGTITMNLDPLFPSSCDPLNSELVLTVYNPTLNTEVTSLSINYNPPIDNQTSLIIDISDINELESQHYYRFRLKSRNANIGTFAKLDVPSTMSNSPIGGLRIDKITTHDGLDEVNDIIAEYDYSESENTTVSSGISFIPHNNYHYFPLNNGTPQVLFHNSPQYSFHNFYGSHITYERVKTINNERGYTISKLKPIVVASEALFPLKPQSYNNELGFAEFSEVYNSEDELLAKVTNIQNEDDLSNIHNTEIYSIRTAPFYNYLVKYYNPNEPYSTFYNIKTGISRTKSSTMLRDGLEYTTEYTYFTGSDAEKCFKPQYTKITDDLGLLYETRNKYTFKYDVDFKPPQNNDGDASYCIHAKLKQLNIVGLQWQNETRHNGILINGSRKKIKLYDNNTGKRVLCNSNSSNNISVKLWKNYRIENNFSENNGWQPLTEIVRYDRIEGGGKLRSPEKIVQDGWQSYTENIYDNLNRLTETRKVTTISGAQPTIKTTYNYKGTSGILSSITAPDGTSASFEYDDYLRKYKEIDCHGVETTVTYDIEGVNASIPKNVISTVTDFSLNTLNIDPNSLSNVSMLESKNFLDGLGRSVQKIGVNQSRDGIKDLASIMQFDNYGNSTKSYFQYESTQGNNGLYTTTPINLVHSVKNFDNSPLNRIESTDPPGELGLTTLEYGANELLDLVFYYDNPNAVYYDPYDLKKATSIDQNGHKTVIFTDKFGRKVLSRRENGTNTNERTDTYYIYDPKHQLIAVLPPGANMNTPNLNYEYSYYPNNHLKSKKVPGADEILYLYNNRELLAATQDGNMRAENPNKWLAYEYDEHGRMVKTGFIYQTLINESFNNPIITEVLSIHSFDSIKHRPEKDENRILETSDFLYTKYYYNTCGDLTETRSNNHLSIAFDSHIEIYQYDEMGNMIEQNTTIQIPGRTLRYDERLHYDHIGRMLETDIRYNGSGSPWKTICKSEYDDQERLKTKYLGKTSSSWLQKVDYEYFDWGALKSINGDGLPTSGPEVGYHNNNVVFFGSSLDGNDVFQMRFYYNENLPSSYQNASNITNNSNGNISALQWQTRGKRSVANTYGYDFKNRLVDSEFHEEGTLGSFVNTDDYSTSFTHDDRGNIELITRKDQGNTTTVDHNYIAGTNQLQGSLISESSNNNYTYSHNYDANGNNTSYQNNPVEYNFLDLPTAVHGEMSHVGVVPMGEFTYSSSGQKLTSRFYSYAQGNETSYEFIGPFELTYESGSLSHIKAHYENGFLSVINNSTPTFNYVLADHLGNNRVVFNDKDESEAIDHPSEIISRNDYYPFGKRFKENYTSGHRQGYNYIENGFHDNQIDLNFATFRTLDANLGLWMQVDPKAESAYGHSPYNSMFNNPISMSDPDGDFAFLAFAAIGVAVNGIGNAAKGNNFFQGWAGAAIGGALSGGYLSALGSGVSGHLPSVNIGLGGGLNFNLSPALAFGNGGVGVGYNAGLSFGSNGFSGGISLGGSYFDSGIGTGKAGFESRVGVGVGYQTGDFNFQLGKNHFGSGGTSQTTGFAQVGYKDWSFNFDNDVLGDGGDRYRTAGIQLNYKDYTVFGLNMFTGDPGMNQRETKNFGDDPYGTYISSNGNDPDKYRYSNLYIGYKGYRVGYGSEGIRDFFQNQAIHRHVTHSPFFKTVSGSPKGFQFGRYTKNSYTTW